MYTLRFDLRSSVAGAKLAALYRATIDMCAWAETRGGTGVLISEHHGAADNHLPSPLILGAAVAAGTRKIGIILAAVVLPLYEPIRLAEEMNVLDLISEGRVSYVFGIGHRHEEYAHFGAEHGKRGRAAGEKLAIVLQLLQGKPVELNGRMVHVTPPPLTPGGPRIMIGGGSLAAVKRAARHGLGFVGQANTAGLAEAYVSECRAHGHEPLFASFPDPATPTAVFVADDVERAWKELGPYLLKDAKMAASYRHGDNTVASITRANTVAEMRASNGPYRIFTRQEAAAELRAGRKLPLHPLCGGIPPELAWPYLECASAAAGSASQQKKN